MGPQRSVAPFLKACFPPKEAVSPEGDIAAVTQNGQEESATTGGGDLTPVEGGACAPSAGVGSESYPDGLSHHGDPAEPGEVEETETQEAPDGAQEEDEEGPPARLVRAPRSPSQSERELHEAVHLPHAEWCEYCVRGRARNKPHKSRKNHPSMKTKVDVTELPWEGQVRAKEESADKVPKISLDYFSLELIRRRGSLGIPQPR